jgi:hypothetical protein
VVSLHFSTVSPLSQLVSGLDQVVQWFETLQVWRRHVVGPLPNVQQMFLSSEPLLGMEPCFSGVPVWTVDTVSHPSVLFNWDLASPTNKWGQQGQQGRGKIPIPPIVQSYGNSGNNIFLRSRFPSIVRRHFEKTPRTESMVCTREYRAQSEEEDSLLEGDTVAVTVDLRGRPLERNGWFLTVTGQHVPAFCFGPNRVDPHAALRKFVSSDHMGVEVMDDGSFAVVGFGCGWACTGIELTQSGLMWVARGLIKTDARGALLMSPVEVAAPPACTSEEALRILFFVWCEAVAQARPRMRATLNLDVSASIVFDTTPREWPCENPFDIVRRANEIRTALLNHEAAIDPTLCRSWGEEDMMMMVTTTADQNTTLELRVGDSIVYLNPHQAPGGQTDYFQTEIVGFDRTKPCWVVLGNGHHDSMLVTGSFDLALFDGSQHVLLTGLAPLSHFQEQQ